MTDFRVTHATSSAEPDSGDGKISSNAWNEDHTIEGLGTAAGSDVEDFAPASHTHVIANVTGLQTALDGKQPVGSYALASDLASYVTTAGFTFANLGSKPTTLAGYGITDPVWTSANDGAGSGLDADLLDGQHAASFAPLVHTHVLAQITDAGTAAGLNSDADGTLSANSNTRLPTQAAVVTYIAARIAALINSAPGALDTLKELADALGDDPNFAATMATALAGKLAAASNLSDILSASTARGNLGLGTAATHAATDFQTAGSYLTANQAITLSGDISGSGATAITVTIGANKVTRGMLAATSGATLLGATAAGNVADLTAAQAKTFLAITAADVTAAGSTTQVLFNDAGAFAGDAGLTFNKTTKSLTIGGATVTTSNPVVNGTQAWNASGVTFTADKINITDTASAATSMLIDRQVGGVSMFNVDKNGLVSSKRGLLMIDGQAALNTAGVIAASNSKIGFGGGSVTAFNTAQDTYFTRVAAGIMKLNNSGSGTPALGTGSGTVANLAAAATAGAGARAFVTDATATLAAGIGTTVAGAGGNKVPVYSDGTNWLIG